MAKLRVLSGKDVCAILGKHGFVKARKRGSHVVMQRKMATSTVTIIVPDYGELRVGTLRSIIRQSGLPRGEFEI